LLGRHGNLLRPLHDVIETGNRVAELASNAIGPQHRTWVRWAPDCIVLPASRPGATG